METKEAVTIAPNAFSSDQKPKLEPQGPVHKPLASDADSDEVVASDLPEDKRPRLDDEKNVCSGAPKPFTEKRDFRKPVRYSPSEIRAITQNFNEVNLIGLTQFGTLYRGKIQNGDELRVVTVKTWDERSDRFPHPPNKGLMIHEEAKFLTHPSMKGHPNLVKYIGGYRDKRMKAIVYDLNPLDTLHNYMTKDAFSWIQRIKVALAFARLLKSLHCRDEPYVLHNIDTTHIMLDKDCNPILLDFGLISGGIIGEMTYIKDRAFMSPCYGDIHWLSVGGASGKPSVENDVFSYGVILLELISKRIITEHELCHCDAIPTYKWAQKQYKPGYSLAHRSLQKQSGYNASDGLTVTELALQCVTYLPRHRPSIERVVECLENLSVSKLMMRYRILSLLLRR